MHPPTLRTLEFDRIVEVVSTFALTPRGAQRVAALQPVTDADDVRNALALTLELVVLHDEVGGLPLRASDDLEPALQALGFEGRALEPRQLLALADFLDGTGRTRSQVARASATRVGGWPQLRQLAEALMSFTAEIVAVRRAIGSSGEVVDDASDALRQIRTRLRRHRHHLRTTLEGYVRGRDTARYLQEPVVTERSGRFVLMVKAEHRSAIPGLIHGASASGASHFLEPLATVEINNDIVALEEQEAEEVQRILRALADRFRARSGDLQHTLDAAAAIDLAQAKARFSMAIRGVVPDIATDGRLELRGARHPLLMAAVRQRLNRESGIRDQESGIRDRGSGIRDQESGRGADPVPVDLLVIPPTRVLVITGPNTGGKTVALKTAGLLTLMAQAGLLVAAEEGTQLPVFRSIFADIGDEQSIAANLSTFSAHVTNIAAMDRALVLPGLILLDELGTATDPTDGAALGVAVVDHFRRRGAIVLVTTHHDQLKSYAMTTEGVTPAAFSFDPVTFAPTYSLLYGSPGTSLAFEIASRLRLDPAIVDRARAERTAEQVQLADRLARMDRELHAIEREQQLARRAREHAEVAAAAVQAREAALREREARLRSRLETSLNERLREARREVDRVVAELKTKAAEIETDARRRAAPRLVAVTTGELGSLRRDARARLAQVTDRVQRPDEEDVVTEDVPPSGRKDASAPRAARVGERVIVESLGIEGVVRSLSSRGAEIDIKGKRLRAALNDVRPASARGGEAGEPRGHVTVTVQPSDAASTELNVIGCTVDDALARADKFLDQAVLSETRVVRLIHGHGAGRLRKALASFLRTHPLVITFGPAAAEHGGTGVTVVELKE